MRRLTTIALLLLAFCLQGAIPGHWLADKVRFASADRNEIYEALPTRHQPIATLPERLAKAFRREPSDLTIYIGEAYFVNHCVNHHPEVPNAVYRRLQDFLEAPEEVILDHRDGKDGLVLTKSLNGTLYILALRHYPAPQSQIVYKTIFPSDGRPYPNLPRFKLSTEPPPDEDTHIQEPPTTTSTTWDLPKANEAPVVTPSEPSARVPFGPLGSVGNPILCTSVPNAERYLAALRDHAGAPVRFRRFTLHWEEKDAGVPLDGWILRLSDGSDQTLYINPNATEETLRAPVGFTLSGFRPIHDEAWLTPLLKTQ